MCVTVWLLQEYRPKNTVLSKTSYLQKIVINHVMSGVLWAYGVFHYDKKKLLCYTKKTNSSRLNKQKRVMPRITSKHTCFIKSKI